MIFPNNKYHSKHTNNNKYCLFITIISMLLLLFIIPCSLLVLNWNQLLLQQNNIILWDYNNDHNNSHTINNHNEFTSKLSSAPTKEVLFRPMMSNDNNINDKTNDVNNDEDEENNSNNNSIVLDEYHDNYNNGNNSVINNEGIDQKFINNDNNNNDENIHNDHNDQDLPYCTREQIRHGQWIPMIYNQPPYISKTKHLRCPPIYHYYDNYHDMLTSNNDPSLLFSSSLPQQQRSDVLVDEVKVDDDYMNITEWHTYDWVPNSSILTSYDNGNHNMSVTPYHHGNNDNDDNNDNVDNQKCLFLRWNQTDFCHNILPTGTISIIGDSLSWEQYSSLLQLLGQKVRQTSQFTSKNHYTNHIQNACHNIHNGTYSKFIYRNLSKPNGTSIQHSIDEDFPFIIVFNRGAHYVNNTIFIDDMLSIINVIETWQNKCIQYFNITCYLFYRTTVPGHVNCSNFTNPYNNYNDIKDYTENIQNYNVNTTEYHWYDFHSQNEIVIDLFSKSTINYYILDAYDIAILRPDKHRYYQGKHIHTKDDVIFVFECTWINMFCNDFILSYMAHILLLIFCFGLSFLLPF